MTKKTLLVINSSPNLTNSISRALTEHFVESLDGQYHVTYRDLGRNPNPYLEDETLEAIVSSTITTPKAEATKELLTELVAEFKNADLIVLGAPMYNFTITAQLKSYFDHIVRSGLTYGYTSSGPRGLLVDKPVIVLSASGGVYHGSAQDHLAPYIKTILGFIGIENVHFIVAEGLGMTNARETSVAKAKAEIDAYVECLLV